MHIPTLIRHKEWRVLLKDSAGMNVDDKYACEKKTYNIFLACWEIALGLWTHLRIDFNRCDVGLFVNVFDVGFIYITIMQLDLQERTKEWQS